MFFVLASSGPGDCKCATVAETDPDFAQTEEMTKFEIMMTLALLRAVLATICFQSQNSLVRFWGGVGMEKGAWVNWFAAASRATSLPKFGRQHGEGHKRA